MKTNVIRGNFSMAQIDEVSSLLGELKSGQANTATKDTSTGYSYAGYQVVEFS